MQASRPREHAKEHAMAAEAPRVKVLWPDQTEEDVQYAEDALSAEAINHLKTVGLNVGNDAME
eukprot:4253684-Prymnesium_polylepis.1